MTGGVVRRDGLREWRKRPVVIEARRFVDNASAEDIAKWGGSPPFRLEIDPATGACNSIAIETLEGTMWADLGDWVIRGVKGEFYPCKPDIFAATYEPADALDAVPDVPPTDNPVTRSELDAAIGRADPHADLASLSAAIWPLFARPTDVPPDPPAVEVRTFHLQRDADVSGVSGTGLVAWGVLFPDGRVATRWAQSNAGCQTSAWDSIEDVEAVHGHNGATRIVWHLVAAADVRARALEDAAKDIRRSVMAGGEDGAVSRPLALGHGPVAQPLRPLVQPLGDAQVVDRRDRVPGLREDRQVRRASARPRARRLPLPRGPHVAGREREADEQGRPAVRARGDDMSTRGFPDFTPRCPECKHPYSWPDRDCKCQESRCRCAEYPYGKWTR